MADLAVVVVTYKTKELVLGFLASVYKELEAYGLTAEVYAVDNASRDGTVEAVREQYPLASTLDNTENLGPARAFNQGIARGISEEFILVANSDIKVLPGTIKVMLEYLKANPNVMGVSGPLLNEDGSRQQTRTQIVGLRKPKWDKPFPVEFVGTTFALIRREAYLTLGGYDENYYFFNEDVDWAERAKRQGLRFMALPEAKVIHFASKGMAQNRSRIMKELYWSNIYYFKKFHPRLSWLIYRLLLLEIRRKTNNLKKQLSTQEDKQGIEAQIEDLKTAKQLMRQHYENPLSPKIPIWR